jgi:hypothetical protein
MVLLGKPKEKRALEDLGIYWMIILKTYVSEIVWRWRGGHRLD